MNKLETDIEQYTIELCNSLVGKDSNVVIGGLLNALTTVLLISDNKEVNSAVITTFKEITDKLNYKNTH